MKWFKHLTSAHDGKDLTKVRIKYGADGYAIYWYCLELIAGELGTSDEINFELKHDAEVIAFNLKVDQLRVEEIMRYMVSLELFEQSSDKITCLKLAKYIDKKLTRNSKIHEIVDAQIRLTELSQTVPDSAPTSGGESGRSPLDTDTDTENYSTSDSQANTDTVSAKITKKQQESIIELYHEMLPELSTVLVNRWHGSKHATALANRWKEDPQFRSKTFWTKFFNTVRQNSWWMGLPDPVSQQSWKKCNLAWLVNRTNFDKVMQLGNDLSREL